MLQSRLNLNAYALDQFSPVQSSYRNRIADLP